MEPKNQNITKKFTYLNMNVSPLFLAVLSFILQNFTLGGNIHYPQNSLQGGNYM